MDEITEIDLWSFATFIIVAYFGVWWHWRKMKRAGRISGTFRDYLFYDYPGSTFGVGASVFLASWVQATTGIAAWLNPELLWAMIAAGKVKLTIGTAIGGAFSAAFFTGYGLESWLNKGANKKTGTEL